MRSSNGPGDPRLIVGGAARRPAAGQRRIAEMAAAARVHRRDQLDPRREGDMGVGAGDADVAGLERLAKRIEHRALEFGQLVEEQDAEVRKADLARAGPEARRRPAPASRRCGAASGTDGGGGSARRPARPRPTRPSTLRAPRTAAAAAGFRAGRRRAATCPRPAARSSADCARPPRRSRARAWRLPGP